MNDDELIEERNVWRDLAIDLAYYAKHIGYEEYPDSAFGDEAVDVYRWFCEVLKHYGDGRQDMTREEVMIELLLNCYSGPEIMFIKDPKEERRNTVRALWRIFDERKAGGDA